ncbi:MAG: SDR family oxidoreductase [Deferribacteres bacterium]|nr:SDR family oxidoreductase [Deferribacteres bacterium]
MFQLDFSGKTVLVTGASRGIGKAVAEAFSKANAEVLLVARNEKLLREVAREISAADYFAVDVGDFNGVKELYGRIEDKYGKLDVLVNNAGISLHFKSFHKTSPDEWDKMIDVNIKGVMNNARCAFELLKKGKNPVVVNVASIAGIVGAQKIAVYCATKGAVVNFTKALAVEWASHGIRVVGVCPGYVKTDMTQGVFSIDDFRRYLLSMIPMRRFAEPEEIAGTVLFAASELASYITGTCLVVDGGLLAGA